MDALRMVDLRREYLSHHEEIDSAIAAVLHSSEFVSGSHVTAFEDALGRYVDCPYVVGVGNGTDALYLALRALGVCAGDEVIVPAFTFISPVEVVASLGARPVLVDVDWETMTLDVSQIESSITPRTKAIIPVHLFGQCADIEAIMRLSKMYNLRVVEDACQSIGARVGDRFAGTFGDIGCVSFYPSKNLGCYGDGGAVYTCDGALAAQIRRLANHGSDEKYLHESIGINSRLDSLQASILLAKLAHLEEWISSRQRAAHFYDNALADCEDILLPCAVREHTFHQYTLRLVGERRDAVRARLSTAGVPTMVYYPHPVHLQPAYAYLGYRKGDFPIAERLSECVLSLPMHPFLSEEQLEYVSKNLIASL